LPRVSHQPGREPHDRLTAVDQEPFQAAGHAPDVLDPPHPLAVELATPLQQLTEPVPLRRDRPLRDLHPERIDRDPGMRLPVGIDPDRQHTVRPFLE
jgi:hypothetical protein